MVCCVVLLCVVLWCGVGCWYHVVWYYSIVCCNVLSYIVMCNSMVLFYILWFDVSCCVVVLYFILWCVAGSSLWGYIFMVSYHLCNISRFIRILCKRSRCLVTWLLGINGKVTYPLLHHIVAQTMSATHSDMTVDVYCYITGVIWKNYLW